jgi:signal transduction histidine kinase
MSALTNIPRRFVGSGVVAAAFVFSLGVFFYHILAHQVPLLSTIFGQWAPFGLSLVFGGIGYSVLTTTETPRERTLVGVRTGAAYVLGGIASGGYAFHQHLSPEVSLTAEAVLFQATFVAIVAGIFGLGLGLEAIRRNRIYQELNRSVEQLEATNTRLDEFASVVSHDLRTPLSTAIGRIELASEDSTSDDLDAARKALSRMERIIDSVLLLAREGGELSGTNPVELHEIVGNAWTIVAADMDRPELRTAADVGENLPTIEADTDRLQQLLENLFRNAIEHGGPDVTVRIEPMANGFAVADDGPGIAPTDRHRVFDVGYTTAEDGTGYGLRIVRQVADAHDWDLSIAESEDGGARFELTSVTVE